MKFKKFILYFLLALQLSLCLLPIQIWAKSIDTNTVNKLIVPYADDIRWEYKTVNGVLYRRLYNFTTLSPVSDWERVS